MKYLYPLLEEIVQLILVVYQKYNFFTLSFSIKVYQKYSDSEGDYEPLSQLHIVKLCGSENTGTEYSDPKAKQFAIESFNSLSQDLLSAGLCKKPPKKSRMYSILPQLLSTSINPYGRVLFITCIDNQSTKWEISLPALKFSSRIRECLLSKSATDPSDNPKKPLKENRTHRDRPDLPVLSPSSSESDNILPSTRKNEDKINFKDNISPTVPNLNEDINEILKKKYEDVNAIKDGLTQTRLLLQTQKVGDEKKNMQLKLDKLQKSVHKNEAQVGAISERINSYQHCMELQQVQQLKISKLRAKNKLLKQQLQEAKQQSEQEHQKSKFENIQEQSRLQNQIISLENMYRQKEIDTKITIDSQQKDFTNLQIAFNKIKEQLFQEQQDHMCYKQQIEAVIQIKDKEISELQNTLYKYDQKNLDISENAKLIQQQQLEQISQLTEELKKMQQKSTEYKVQKEEEINFLDANLKSTSNSLETEKKNNIKLTEENQNLLDQKVEAQRIIAELTTQLQSASQEEKKLNMQFVENESKIHNLEKQNTLLLESNKELAQKLSESQNSLERAKSEAQRISGKIKGEFEDKLSSIQREFTETLQAKEMQSLELQGILSVRNQVQENDKNKIGLLKKENKKLKADNDLLMWVYSLNL